MKNEPLFIAFASPKGGVGKTAITVLTACYLHFVKGYNVAVVDCDFPQHSIAQMRERETRLATEDSYIKMMVYDHFKSIGKKAYPVIEAKTSEAIDEANNLISENAQGFDIVFFDLQETLKSKGVVEPL